MRLYDTVIALLVLLASATLAALAFGKNPYTVHVAEANPYTVQVVTPAKPLHPIWDQKPTPPVRDEVADAWQEAKRRGVPLMVWVRFFDRPIADKIPQAVHVHVDRDYWNEDGPTVVIQKHDGQGNLLKWKVSADDCSEASLRRMAGLSPPAQDTRPARRVGGWGQSTPAPASALPSQAPMQAMRMRQVANCST